MNLDNLAYDLHETALEKGFWDPVDRMSHEDIFVFYAKQLAMIHSEVTEVLEAVRKQKGETAIVEELADIVIRVLDLYGGMRAHKHVSVSLDQTLKDKARFNMARSRLHGTLG
jgi:NTP pyrophosphatase (non-canonical NTP hydrolase)